MRLHVLALGAFFLWITTGCAPVIVGAGATGVYKVGTDERSTGGMFEDSTITVKVKNLLVQDSSIKARRIDVDTVDRTVFLSGVVETEEESAKAAEIAASVRFVKDVVNNLQIGERSLGQAFDDSVTASKIKGQLVGEKGIRSLNIDVDVYMGVASLTGTAKTIEQKEKIIKIADETYGTVRIIDNIKVLEP